MLDIWEIHPCTCGATRHSGASS